MALGGRVGYTQQTTFLYPRVSSFIFLHNGQVVSPLLSHLTTKFSYTVVAGMTAHRPLGDVIHSCWWAVGKHVSVAHLRPALDGSSVGHMVVHQYLSVFILPHCVAWI